jgi:hypothetical protein
VSEISTIITIESVTCGECGTLFGLGSGFKKNRLEDGRSFFCPNGHGISWSESEVVKLRRSLQNAQEEAIRARNAAAHNDAERAKAEKKIARLLKRVKAGVCPAGCKRSFTNLRRHVETLHPAIAGEIRLAEAKSR